MRTRACPPQATYTGYFTLLLENRAMSVRPAPGPSTSRSRSPGHHAHQVGRPELRRHLHWAPYRNGHPQSSWHSRCHGRTGSGQSLSCRSGGVNRQSGRQCHLRHLGPGERHRVWDSRRHAHLALYQRVRSVGSDQCLRHPVTQGRRNLECGSEPAVRRLRRDLFHHHGLQLRLSGQ